MYPVYRSDASTLMYLITKFNNPVYRSGASTLMYLITKANIYCRQEWRLYTHVFHEKV
jgi:hypothetical protein